MSRVKRGVTGHAKHKKVFKAAKGYYGRRKNTIRIAKQAVEKAGQYAFRDRKRKKRTFRALWIQRLNAAVRPFGLTYSRFIDGLAKSGVTVDRKVLSDLAISEPAAFAVIDTSEITDPDIFSRQLLPKETATLVPFGGQYVVRTDNIAAIDETAPKRLVVIAFQSPQAAKAWASSAAEKELAALRMKSTKSRVFIADGAIE